MTESSERWFVVKAEPCERCDAGTTRFWCVRCDGRGWVTDLDSAVEVEQQEIWEKEYSPVDGPIACWVATERTEQ